MPPAPPSPSPSHGICDVFRDINLCMNPQSPKPHIEAKHAGAYLLQSTRGMRMKSESLCHTKGMSCFTNNIRSASSFIGIFLIATFITNALHELFHFLMVFFGGVPTTGFTFSILGGSTNLTAADVTDYSMLFWYFAIMGPLLVVNMGSILFIIFMYRPQYITDHSYVNATTSARASEMFAKSVGYVSAIIILTNTVLSPLFYYLADYFGIAMASDLMVMWTMSYHFPVDPAHVFSGGTLLRISVIVTTGLEVFVALYYILVYGKRSFM